LNSIWFPRFAEIPGIGYQGSPDVDRQQLPGYDHVPTIERRDVNGARDETLWWPSENGRTSISPAQGHVVGDLRHVPMPEILRNVYESLELPGTASDYHFLLQGSIGEVWRRRRDNPDMLPEVEKLAWLDVRLVEACPEAVTFEGPEGPKVYAILAFSILIDLYEREGFLHEALAIADRAVRLLQCEDDQQRLQGRLATLEAEDAR
jgi:hypothetical protein